MHRMPPTATSQADMDPPFLQGRPVEPALEELVQAFLAGDFARVRKEAPALAENADDTQVRNLARELRRRIDPDPLMKYLLGISVSLLVFLVVYFYAIEPH